MTSGRTVFSKTAKSMQMQQITAHIISRCATYRMPALRIHLEMYPLLLRGSPVCWMEMSQCNSAHRPELQGGKHTPSARAPRHTPLLSDPLEPFHLFEQTIKTRAGETHSVSLLTQVQCEARAHTTHTSEQGSEKSDARALKTQAESVRMSCVFHFCSD